MWRSILVWGKNDLVTVISTVLPVPLVASIVYLEPSGPWIAGVLTYLGFLVLPGFVIFRVLRANAVSNTTAVDLIVYSNVLGISILATISWSLARAGLLTYPNILAIQEATLGGIILFRWLTSKDMKLPPVQSRITDFAFIALCAILSGTFLIPRLNLLSNGLLIGGDDAIISRVGQVAFQIRSWPSLSQVLHPYVSPADVAPGGPLVFGLFGSAMGVNPIFVSPFFGILSSVLSALALSLLVSRFTDNPIIVMGLPIVWLVGYAGAPFFFNLILTFAFQGGTPESILSIPLLVVSIVLLIDIVREDRFSRSRVLLLGILVSGIMLLSQITFLMMGFLLVAFGVVMLATKGLRSFLESCIIIGGLIAVLVPPYLNFQEALGNSPSGKFSMGSLNQIYQPYASSVVSAISSIGTVATILLIPGVALPLLGVGKSLYSQDRRKMIATLAGLVVGIISYSALSFSAVGASLLGIQAVRFVEYIPLVVIPLVAEGLQRMLSLVQGFRFAKLAPIALLAVIATSAYVGAAFNIQSVSAGLATPNIFGHWQLTAANWLAQNGVKGVVVADANNASYNVVFLLNFANHQIVYRDMFEDFQTVYGNPYPFNQPFYYANLVLTNPNSTNVREAFERMNFTYYFLEIPYNNKQIAAFSLLPYMELVYTNPNVDIFRYTGYMENSSYLIPATGYSFATKGVQAQYSGYGALNASVSYPAFPNTVSSSGPDGPSFDGNHTSYTLEIQHAGNYSVFVHRDVFKTSEYLLVSRDQVVQGAIFFASSGWTFGTPLRISLPAGKVVLTFTFEGTDGWADPTDYLVVVPLPS